MKITKKQLKQIIKEELRRVLEETELDDPRFGNFEYPVTVRFSDRDGRAQWAHIVNLERLKAFYTREADAERSPDAAAFNWNDYEIEEKSGVIVHPKKPSLAYPDQPKEQ